MKNKLIKSTIILMIGGLLTKILGMIIRIVMSRLLGSEGIGLYMMIMPTFSLCIGISIFGLPTAISKLVAEDNKNNKNLVFSLLPISIIINFIIIIILIVLSPFISTYLLKQSILKNSIICIGLVLPFISISNMLRGYFFGKERMIPHVISNIIEDLVRLIVISVGVPYFLIKGINYAVSFIILSNIISELTSILILFIFLPKNFSIKKSDFKINKIYLKETLNISIPTTGSRIIGSIGYFLEPIIINFFLSLSGYSNVYIVNEYGIINGYVMPLILLPSFFTGAVSSALLPIISKSYSNKDYKNVIKKIKQGIIISLIIGIPFTIFIVIYPELPLNLLYKTNDGVNYIRFFAPFCLLHYIQSILTVSMQGIGSAKEATMDTLVGMIIRTISLIILSLLHIGLYSLLIASILNISYITIKHYLNLRKLLYNKSL